MIQLNPSDWTDNANMQTPIPRSTLHVPSKCLFTDLTMPLGVLPFALYYTNFLSFNPVDGLNIPHQVNS